MVLYRPFQNRTIPCSAPHSCHMNALLVSHHIASSAISAVASTLSISTTFSKAHPSPRPAPPHLPPLSKGGGLTARHKLSLCCIFTCDTSAFFIHQTFCRQDGGIAIPPFAQHHIYASLVKGEVLSPKRIRATTGGIAFLPHPFRFSDTSVNNPSVTVTENTILCQRIFNFYKKQY